MTIVWLIAGAAILLFGLVILFGAPYLPTLAPQIESALDLMALKRGQTLLELGCGDGRVLKAAAKRGIKVVGIELNPALVLVAKAVTWRQRKLVKVVWGNYWTRAWPPADGIFVFLISKYMKKLDTKIDQYNSKPLVVASFGFKIPGKQVTKKANGVYLYKY